MTDEFTLPLAILDFVPVLLTAVGFIFIVRMIFSVLPTQGRTALFGGLMVVAGGFLRALWKLLIVLSGGDLVIDWMGDSLFVLMAPGFILSAWSIWQFVRSVQGKAVFHPWLVPLVLIVMIWSTSYFLVSSQPNTDAWKGILISITVLGNWIGVILLITLAFRYGLPTAGWLFLVNIAITFITNGLARTEQTIMIHWIAESVGSISSLCFAMAAKIVCEYMSTHFSMDSVVGKRLASTAQGR